MARGGGGRSGGQSADRARVPPPPSTHTGLELGVDVAQRVKGLVQDVPQGRISHGLQDLHGQGQLGLQGHGALPHLRTGDRDRRESHTRGDRWGGLRKGQAKVTGDRREGTPVCSGRGRGV